MIRRSDNSLYTSGFGKKLDVNWSNIKFIKQVIIEEKSNKR